MCLCVCVCAGVYKKENKNVSIYLFDLSADTKGARGPLLNPVLVGLFFFFDLAPNRKGSFTFACPWGGRGACSGPSGRAPASGRLRCRCIPSPWMGLRARRTQQLSSRQPHPCCCFSANTHQQKWLINKSTFNPGGGILLEFFFFFFK